MGFELFDREQERNKLFTRRALFIGALQTGIMVLLGSRLAFLQVVEGERYKTLSDKNRINLKLLAPARGNIVDRFGVPLAVNQQNFRVLLVPEQTDNIEYSLRKLQQIIPIEQSEIDAIIKKVKRSPSYVPVDVRENLNWDQVSALEVNLPELPGLTIDVGEIRSYPLREATAHLIGYVGSVAKTEVRDDPIFKLPGFQVGKSGIEKALDDMLMGQAGTAQVEVNVLGREVRQLDTKPARAGERVTLNVDAELQRAVQERLNMERSASAVVMDAQTGAVYALASSPSFDPNIFTGGISAERWEELLSNPANALSNKAVAGQYPPGSTFKMVTAMAALEAGVANRNTRVFCPGHFDLGKDRFHCWKKTGHGSVNMNEALAGSCDTYFYRMALDTGIDKIAAMARRLGLGQKYGIELAEEKAGLVPDIAWKRSKLGQPWHRGETIVAGIGQGYLQTTPLQLAVMTARLVNGGKAVKPSLVSHVGESVPPETVWPSLGLNQDHLAQVCEGMNLVTNSTLGTAYGSRISDPLMAMGGKTGTAQVRRITKKMRLEGYSVETMPWQFRHHALFVGYAPVSQPRYVCAVVVEHGSSGSGAAAPLARDIMLYAQNRNPAFKPVQQDISDHKEKLPLPSLKPAKPDDKGN